MSSLRGTLWEGVGMWRLRAAPDPDSPARAVALPLAWAEEEAAALTAIKTASGEVLDELGAILGLLRGGADPTSAGALQPQVGLERLDDLVTRARADRLIVTVTGAIQTGSLPRPVSIAGYRVVQEALSNVRRHAGPGAAVQVHVEVAEGRIRVEVADDGGNALATVRSSTPTARRTVAEGFGLVGMRERVVATGGRLEAGPLADGGFRVVAAWPAR